MSIWNSVKNLFGFNVSTTINFPYIDLLVPAIFFVIIMFVANMFFKNDKKKLLYTGLLAAFALYIFFFA